VSVPYFLLFLYFRKVTQEIFSELDETKVEPPIFTKALRRPKIRRRGARSQAHHRGGRPSPWPRRPMVRPGGPTSDAAPPPIKSLPKENPKTISKFPERVPQLCRRRQWISGDISLYFGTLPGRGSALIAVLWRQKMCLMPGKWPAHWEPQEEGVMNIAPRFSLS
jgi:hypothetical protein